MTHRISTIPIHARATCRTTCRRSRFRRRTSTASSVQARALATPCATSMSRHGARRSRRICSCCRIGRKQRRKSALSDRPLNLGMTAIDLQTARQLSHRRPLGAPLFLHHQAAADQQAHAPYRPALRRAWARTRRHVAHRPRVVWHGHRRGGRYERGSCGPSGAVRRCVPVQGGRREREAREGAAGRVGREAVHLQDPQGEEVRAPCVSLVCEVLMQTLCVAGRGRYG